MYSEFVIGVFVLIEALVYFFEKLCAIPTQTVPV